MTFLLDTNVVSETWRRSPGFGAPTRPRPLPVIDSLLAATAIARDLTLVTRNVADVESTGASLMNPWEAK